MVPDFALVGLQFGVRLPRNQQRSSLLEKGDSHHARDHGRQALLYLYAGDGDRVAIGRDELVEIEVAVDLLQGGPEELLSPFLRRRFARRRHGADYAGQVRVVRELSDRVSKQ